VADDDVGTVENGRADSGSNGLELGLVEGPLV
jgi:hypothetical protein